VLTGPVQPKCSTHLVEVAADPLAVQLPSACIQHACGRRCAAIVAACGCWTVPAARERMPCVVWSQQGLRPVAIDVGGIPRIVSPLILSGSLGDALHNPQTLQ